MLSRGYLWNRYALRSPGFKQFSKLGFHIESPVFNVHQNTGDSKCNLNLENFGCINFRYTTVRQFFLFKPGSTLTGRNSALETLCPPLPLPCILNALKNVDSPRSIYPIASHNNIGMHATFFSSLNSLRFE